MKRERLKKARKEAGMTQQQMADRLGLMLGHYQKIEYGNTPREFRKLSRPKRKSVGTSK